MSKLAKERKNERRDEKMNELQEIVYTHGRTHNTCAQYRHVLFNAQKDNYAVALSDSRGRKQN